MTKNRPHKPINITTSIEELNNINGRYNKVKIGKSQAQAEMAIHTIEVLKGLVEWMGYETYEELINDWKDMDPEGIY
jgi:hypothetical protein